MWHKKYEHEDKLACPVCKADFGIRSKDQLIRIHCIECKTTFWWHPWKDKPLAILDSEKDKGKCGCTSCREKGR